MIFKHLRKYLTNRKDVKFCQGVLGAKDKVSKFHQFWNTNGEDLMVVSAYLVHEFVTNNEFTPQELNAYKKAISDMGAFYHKCYEEREMERLEKEV
tara:strand:+ start:2214 stop:2501 length:288 start_codon:yes stop_codon:yes gene_type:complete